MKLYPNISAEIKMIDNGTSWSIIMRGPVNEVDWLFNAFYNFGATDETHYVWNDAETEAIFFSDRERITKFFTEFLVNKYYHEGHPESDCYSCAQADAPLWVTDLFHNHREARQQYKSSTNDVFGEAWSMGALRNENPDDSFKDAVVRHADKVGMAANNVSPDVRSEVEEMFSQL